MRTYEEIDDEIDRLEERVNRLLVEAEREMLREDMVLDGISPDSWRALAALYSGPMYYEWCERRARSAEDMTFRSLPPMWQRPKDEDD